MIYISKKSNFLTRAIFVAAICNIIGTIISFGIRIILNRDDGLTPAMLDEQLWNWQMIVAFFQLTVTAVVFWKSWKGQKDHEARVSSGGDETGDVSDYAVEELIQVWAGVLVGAGIFYNVTSIVYRQFISDVMELINLADNSTVLDFLYIYNNSHGFKYIGMLIALLLGFYVTAVFLKDRILNLVSAGVTVLFLASFLVMEMNKVNLFSQSIGVVWTSVIFHLVQTVGLLALAAYLAWRYKGL